MDANLQDTLFTNIQNWTKQIPLLVLGSGASIPFGLPSMYALGEYLKNSISFKDPVQAGQFEQFKQELDKTNNFEEAISNVELSEDIHNLIIFKTWELIN